MKAGKVSESVLRRSVLKQIQPSQKILAESSGGVLTAGAAVGSDYTAAQLHPGEQIVLSVCPVTRSREEIGRCGVLEALNNVSCSGARPLGVMVSLLLPTSSNEQELRTLMQELDRAAIEAGCAVFGGHTEVSRRVEEPLVTVTGVGAAPPGRLLMTADVRPGMVLILTKWIGLQATAILARERREALSSRFAKPFLDTAGGFLQYLSVLPEAAAAAQNGAAAMHDLSEGGIFGALWELGQAAGVGIEADLRRIPIRQETVEICEFFDCNPYKILSGGSLLIASEDSNMVLRALEAEGIPAVVIGQTTDGNDRVLFNEDERRFLETAQTDELYKVIP